MMIINVNQLLKAGMNAATSNAPALLTAFGAVGVVGTAVLTGRATFEAAQRISEAERERSLELTGEDDSPFSLTKQEKVKLVWPLYISAISSGALSCGAIVMSHRISSRRAAMLAAAYALNENRIEEYQEKIKEKFGVAKEKEARDEIVTEKVALDYEEDEGTVVFSPLDGKVLIRDDYSGRYFWGTVEDVNRAVNDINREIFMDSSATVSNFYDLIGLDHVSTSDYFGWNTTNRLEIDWSTTTTPDKKIPVHSFSFVNHPMMDPGSAASFR